MKEKIVKEKLTKENVKLDLLEQTKPLPIIIEILLHLMMIAFAALALYKLVSEKTTGTIRYLGIALFVLLVIAYLAVMVYLISLRCKITGQRKMIQNGEFEIVRDTLTVAGEVARFKGGVHEKRSLLDRIISTNNHRVPRRYPIWFQFEKYGDYHLPLTKMYKWSERYTTTDEGMQNTSLIGDEFYIVLYRGDEKKKPAMIYNTKFFDYKDEELW